VINTQQFAETTGGITKYVTQQTKLNNEFKPVNQELTTLSTKINNLKTEIENLQKSNVAKPESINEKIEEANKLAREYKFKQEDAKAKYQSRSGVLLGPITEDVFKALQEYSKQNGYAMILDAGRLDNAGLILAFDRKFDVTDDFIKFYNARPAGTASN
jgi:Skp family chaperone for outer membrane proteins